MIQQQKNNNKPDLFDKLEDKLEAIRNNMRESLRLDSYELANIELKRKKFSEKKYTESKKNLQEKEFMQSMAHNAKEVLLGQIDQYGQIAANLAMIKEFQMMLKNNSKDYKNTEAMKKIFTDTLKDLSVDNDSKLEFMKFMTDESNQLNPLAGLNKIEVALNAKLTQIKNDIGKTKDKVGFFDRQAIDSSMKSAKKVYSSENDLIVRNAKLQSEKGPKHINTKFWKALTYCILFTIGTLCYLALFAIAGPASAPLFLPLAGLAAAISIGAGVIAAYQLYQDKKDPDRINKINAVIEKNVLGEVEKIKDRKKGQEYTKDPNSLITSDYTNNVGKQNTEDLNGNLNNKNSRSLETIPEEEVEEVEGTEVPTVTVKENGQQSQEENGQQSQEEKRSNVIATTLKSGPKGGSSYVENVLKKGKEGTDTNVHRPSNNRRL